MQLHHKQQQQQQRQQQQQQMDREPQQFVQQQKGPQLLHQQQQQEHCTKEEGINISVCAASAPAQKSIPVTAPALATAPAKKECMQLTMPRGELLLLGGDLAYPNPSR
jgi:hypothetical protein